MMTFQTVALKLDQLGHARHIVLDDARSNPMKKLNIAEAKAQFSKLVNDAARGKTTIIAHGGMPVARIVPFDDMPSKIKFGTYKGKIVIPEDFDAPDPDVIDMFETSGPLIPERKR
jgi:prevent-host-death family protein